MENIICLMSKVKSAHHQKEQKLHLVSTVGLLELDSNYEENFILYFNDVVPQSVHVRYIFILHSKLTDKYSRVLNDGKVILIEMNIDLFLGIMFLREDKKRLSMLYFESHFPGAEVHGDLDFILKSSVFIFEGLN